MEPFPHDITLEEIRECIRDRTEFRELTFDDFIVIDYLIQRNDSFPNPQEAPTLKWIFPLH